MATFVWAGMAAGALTLGLPDFARAQDQKPLTLKEAAQKAVLNNPEVLARWHTLKAADNERDVGAGALLPRVDLLAGVGAERRSDATVRSRYDRTSSSLTITQVLYDGFAARNEIKRLDHARLVRLFEFFDTSESVALEVGRAFYDVLRFRDLVALAEENFVQHRSVFEQTERRVKAKIARAVDLEQIGARLALAEANLLTETANLHDASARFQRIVGQVPPVELLLPTQLTLNIPVDATSAVREAQRRNGALRASIENVRASDAALASRQGAYQPRVDLRLRRDRGNNLSGTTGTSETNVAEVVMSWNLFNGFSDRARERQFAEQLNIAKDLRDKTCRDIRQTLLIAYNDVRKLTEQLIYISQNKVSVEKARNAYRLQFDIGQRTLLDLLDTENELYQARRAEANAEHDLNIAYVRTHAGLGTLLSALELSKIETGPVPGLAQWDEGEDAARSCPPEPVIVYVVDKAALLGRAADLQKQTALLNARERAMQEVMTPIAPAVSGARPAGAAASVTPVAPASTQVTPRVPAGRGTPLVAPAPPKAVPPPTAASSSNDVNYSELRQTLQNWRAAWIKRDVDTYLGFYAPNFVPSTGDGQDAWREKRKAALSRAADISLEIADLTVTLTDAANATMLFKQTYGAANYRDIVTKTLQWMKVGERWLIVRESSAAPLAAGQ
ncbi:MAG: TolC family outer membrane protein [Polaromonas sp.]|uniref:TolC family outer membrane protein n=1 Tax=Polaromonas sp. TaxID=1869339 RepID=UPI002736E432|nr:TolC family outer membrane protein [Polaromonas sp.]MDP2817171.1 TolC family outer membrane protein [Polaromonas sp.]